MKQLFILVFCAIFLQAGFLDFIDVSHAKKSYRKKDYKNAISGYKKIQGKDGATYDLANSYYKNKNYKKALNTYKKVSDSKLQFKKLHNMGNTYAHLGKIDEAIKSYEDALKIKKDKDTKYNLDLLKKKKKHQKKKHQKKKKKKKSNRSPKKKDKKDKKSGNNQKKGKNKKKPQNEKQHKVSQNSRGEREKQNQNKDKQQKKQKSQEKKNMTQKKKKVQPISNMEERKYKKMLNQRGINTLMLPLSTKGDKRNEKNPW